MIVGIDFDNTIVNYDAVFHRVATEKGLIPRDLPVAKTAVRDYLRAQEQEDAWTEMQGYVYGVRMSDASLFPGAQACLSKLRDLDIAFYVISHKTRYPYRGPRYDLHKSAASWLKAFVYEPLGLTMRLGENVFFNPSRMSKMECIARMDCTHFIDDLPEFLSDDAFPAKVHPLLFCPDCATDNAFAGRCLSSWAEIAEYLCGE